MVFSHNLCKYICVYGVCVCMCVLESPHLGGELDSTLRYIGKPEKFPPQRGGNIEKSAG